MTADTTPPVGTIVRWGELRAVVLRSWHDYMVVRDVGGCLRALQHVDGEWRDNIDDVWEIVTPEPVWAAIDNALGTQP